MAATASKCPGELMNFPINIRAIQIIGKTELKTNFPQGGGGVAVEDFSVASGIPLLPWDAR